ncbi:hypothetical protein PIB30_093545 [Stylosanthes scabra]|uniref:Reverse transcriptase domain-containing protein n=1 Tax=Stylosanthes scabra TaxID=79078 RepID=A0ABU6SVK1_9FABA|nr:hypothetical protein [Stylosanthes scabra]
MCHWMRSVEDLLAQKPSRKRGCSRSRSGTQDSRNPSSSERHPRRRSRFRERRRSPNPRRRRSPSPRRRRSPSPRKRRNTPSRRSRTPDYHDDGWEQEIVSRTPFAPHILQVRFPRSFTKPTDMGYDGSTDLEDHLDAFEDRMNCECAGDAMRYKAFRVSLADGYKSGTPLSIPFIIGRAVPRYPVLRYLIPRKTNTGTSAVHEGKLSASWKGPFRIKEDLGKGAFKLETLARAEVPRSWNTTHLMKYRDPELLGFSRFSKKAIKKLFRGPKYLRYLVTRSRVSGLLIYYKLGSPLTPMTKVRQIQGSSPFPKIKPRNFAEVLWYTRYSITELLWYQGPSIFPEGILRTISKFHRTQGTWLWRSRFISNTPLSFSLSIRRTNPLQRHSKSI